MRQLSAICIVAAAMLLHSAPVAQAQQADAGEAWQTYDTSNGEWRSYAGDIGGTKYSPLSQIDGTNFSDLEIAWEWLSVDNHVSRATPGGGEWWAPLNTIVDSLVEETPDLAPRAFKLLH